MRCSPEDVALFDDHTERVDVQSIGGTIFANAVSARHVHTCADATGMCKEPSMHSAVTKQTPSYQVSTYSHPASWPTDTSTSQTFPHRGDSPPPLTTKSCYKPAQRSTQLVYKHPKCPLRRRPYELWRYQAHQTVRDRSQGAKSH